MLAVAGEEMSASNASVLKIEGLHLHFVGKQTVKAVDGVDLDITRGEILSLVGESGSGKTTLGRAIVGLSKPTSGRILVDGKQVDTKNRRELKNLWKKVQMIFQDPYSTFNPLASIYDSISIPVRKFKLAKTNSEVRRLVEDTLTKVGLDPTEMEGKYPNQLSGGQRQRASIARALIVDPEVIVADEPVSMLDVSIRAGILDLMKDLNKNLGVTMIFITHDLAVADYISDRIAVMYKGKLVELAPAREIVEAPLHPYTELLLQSAPRLRGHRRWSETQDLIFRQVGKDFHGCVFYPRCPISTEKCTTAEPVLNEVKKNHWAACYVRQDQVNQ
jgi:peptide/nickel transport system ATP-binding protein